MKNRYASRYKDTLLEGTPNQMCVWANKAVRPYLRRMGVGAADDGIFHNNTILPELECFTLCHDAGAEHDAATGTNPHIAADGGGWRHVRRRVNSRNFVEMSNYHSCTFLPFPCAAAKQCDTRGA